MGFRRSEVRILSPRLRRKDRNGRELRRSFRLDVHLGLRRFCSRKLQQPRDHHSRGRCGKPFGSPGCFLCVRRRVTPMPQKPFFRKHDGWWVVQMRQGRKRWQHKLVKGTPPKGADTKQEAYTLFNKMMEEGTDELPAPT